ncbi:hypothetical protein CWI42_091200 [Ordospora colligata]|nr:hypothetical protein CWI42_091200 [Ordospora colligata]
MGGRRNRMRARSKVQSGRAMHSGVSADVKVEERNDGMSSKCNVDFRELNEWVPDSDLDMKDEASGVSVDIDIDTDINFNDNADTVYNGSGCTVMCGDVNDEIKVNVERITNGEAFKINEEIDINATAKAEEDKEIHKRIYSMTPSLKVTMTPQMPVRKVIHDEKTNGLAVKDESVKLPSKMIINRYPGHLFIHIDQVERFMSTRGDIEEVSIRMECKAITHETKKHKPWTSIGVNEMIKIPIEKMDGEGLLVRFVLLLHRKVSGMFSKAEVVKSCESTLVVDVERIHSVHNNLLESMLLWDNYTSKNVFKNIQGFFTNGTPDAWGLRLFLSFVSDDELHLIPATPPCDLRSLSKWLVVKKFSYNMWFKGFVNLRGDVGDVCTNLWKRRYVKCYGYMIFVFNEHSRSLVGTVNLVDAGFDPGASSGIYLENFLSISVGQGNVEFHFDCKEKYELCRSALCAMLPRTLFYKKAQQ